MKTTIIKIVIVIAIGSIIGQTVGMLTSYKTYYHDNITIEKEYYKPDYKGYSIKKTFGKGYANIVWYILTPLCLIFLLLPELGINYKLLGNSYKLFFNQTLPILSWLFWFISVILIAKLLSRTIYEIVNNIIYSGLPETSVLDLYSNFKRSPSFDKLGNILIVLSPFVAVPILAYIFGLKNKIDNLLYKIKNLKPK